MNSKTIETVDDIFSKKPEVAIVELLDGAYGVVELWEPGTPYQEKWKRLWLEKAREIKAVSPFTLEKEVDKSA